MFDLIAFFVIVFFIFTGLIKGFLKQIFSLAAIVGGLAASFIYPEIFLWLTKRFIQDTNLALLASGILTFFAVYFLVLIIGSIIGSLVKGPVKVIDRVIGMTFGLLKGGFLMALLALLLFSFTATRGMVVESSSGSFFLKVGRKVVSLAVKKVDINKIIEEVRRGGI